MLRLMVAVDTFTPYSSSKASQCSSRVRSGFLRRWSGSHSPSIAPLMADGPGGAFAPTSPVSLRLFSHRLIEGSEIPKILATSALGIPRSTASSTFTLRSFEYALMPNSFAEDQASRKPLSQLAYWAPTVVLHLLPMVYAVWWKRGIGILVRCLGNLFSMLALLLILFG